MANIQVTNEKCVIKDQYIVGGDLIINKRINVHHHRPQKLIKEISKPIEFLLPKSIDSFEGRDNEIELLTSWFFTDTKKKKIAIISGPPGYGKTELAKQFVSLSKSNNKIKHILWMNAETPETLTQSFLNLAIMLGLPEIDTETLIRSIYDYFDQTPSIIIFDNAENRASVTEFSPPNDCLCLVTSRMVDWGDDVPSLELTALTPDSAVGVLRSVLMDRYAPSDYPLYMDLANVVSCVPYALQLTAVYLRQEMMDLGKSFRLEEYVEEFKSSKEDFDDKALPEFSAIPYRTRMKETPECLHENIP